MLATYERPTAFVAKACAKTFWPEIFISSDSTNFSPLRYLTTKIGFVVVLSIDITLARTILVVL